MTITFRVFPPFPCSVRSSGSTSGALDCPPSRKGSGFARGVRRNGRGNDSSLVFNLACPSFLLFLAKSKLCFLSLCCKYLRPCICTTVTKRIRFLFFMYFLKKSAVPGTFLAWVNLVWWIEAYCDVYGWVIRNRQILYTVQVTEWLW